MKGLEIKGHDFNVDRDISTVKENGKQRTFQNKKTLRSTLGFVFVIILFVIYHKIPRSLRTNQGGSQSVNSVNPQNTTTPTVTTTTQTLVNPNQEIVADYVQQAWKVEILKKRFLIGLRRCQEKKRRIPNTIFKRIIESYTA